MVYMPFSKQGGEYDGQEPLVVLGGWLVAISKLTGEDTSRR
jgi:hypothetical protein